ncbi:MAG: hypothetical protein U0V73_09490 [Acidimicrobiia bacterium]
MTRGAGTRTMLVALLIAALAGTVSATTTSTTSTTSAASAASATNPSRAGARPRTRGAAQIADAATAAKRGACDPTDSAACLLPWPNDRFTRADRSTPTGRRLDLPKAGMPANADGTRIDPAEWNRNDGFGPASNLVTVVPHVDPVASKLPPVTDIAESLRPDSPLVLLDLTTGKRLAAWAELDANDPDTVNRALIVVPAAALPEGHRIAIGLRNLTTADGTRIQPNPAMRQRLAKRANGDARWIDALSKQGVQPRTLTIAWTFTVASAASLSGRLRSMWSGTNRALRASNGAPRFHVTESKTDGAARIVRGTFDMPRYLTGTGGPGTVLNNAGRTDGRPARNGTMQADFLCTVPTSATPEHPAAMLVYGHGLLGSRDEVLGIGRTGAAANVGFCATDYLGMSTADIPVVVEEFKDLSRFRTQADRMQQGQLAFLLLGRLLHDPNGFATDAAFRNAQGPAIDNSHVAFLGASQGGVLGGVASSITHDWDPVILAVGGIGYNLLLRRSIDFDKFRPELEASYPRPLDRLLVLELIEQLWQRGENAGYAQHLTAKPYPGANAKTVLLLEAFGDHQVANVSTEKLARTLDVPRRAPTLASGRSTDVAPYYGIDPMPSLPHDGSGLVVWDFGTPAPPTTNTPNRAGDDPHGKLADVPQALILLVNFLEHGTIVDVCNGGPCHSPG